MSVNSEILLISSILRDADIQSAMQRGLSPEHFHVCNDEWDWVSNYYLKHRKVPTKNAFKQQFSEFNIKAVNDTTHYADEVRKGHARFILTSAIRDVADLIAEGDIDNAVSSMHTKIVGIASVIGDATNDSDILSSWQDTYEEVAQRVERVAEHGISGIPTGFTTLDDRTGGPQSGHLWIIGARLGVGKSWCMMRMATSAVMEGYTVQYDALEQTRAEVSMRIHTFLSGQVGKELFKNLDLMQGRGFDLKSYHKFLRGLKESVSGKLHVSDSSRGRVSPLTIAAQIERNKPDIVFIDYLTLMESTGSGDWQSVAKLSGDLKNLAGEYGVPIVAASQLNRTAGMGVKEVAGAEALSQSDSIGQDADAVINMRATSASVIEMKLVKYRHGFSGFKWFTEFRPTNGIFREVTRTRAGQIADEDDDAKDKSEE